MTVEPPLPPHTDPGTPESQSDASALASARALLASDPAMPDMPIDPERTRGRYVHTRDGAPAGIDEQFVLGGIAGGVVRIRSTRISASPTSRFETDMRLSPGAISVRLRWVGSTPGAVRSATADYLANDGAIEVTRTVDDLRHESVVAQGFIDAPPLVLAGLTVLRSLNGLDIVAPELADPFAAAGFLAPVSYRSSASAVGAGSVVVGAEERAGTVFQWSRGDMSLEVVVDACGLVLRQVAELPSGRWVATLSEVTGPWPTPTAWPA